MGVSAVQIGYADTGIDIEAEIVMTDRSASCNRAMAISRDMLGCARDKDWAALYEKEVERKKWLQQGLTEPIPADFQQQAAASITAIRDIDRQIMAIIDLNREEIQRALSKLQHGKKASALYLNL